MLGLALVIWYAMRVWPGDRFLAIRLSNYLLPWVLLGLICALAITGLLWGPGKWWLLANLVTLLLMVPMLPLFTPRAGAASAAGDTIRVLSYNVCRPNKDIPAIVKVLRAEPPDLLLLQDVNPDFSKDLISGLFELYLPEEGYLAYDQGSRQMIFSRFSLTSQTIDWNQGRVQRVVADTPDGPIMVWNIHASKPLDWNRHHSEFLALTEAIRSAEAPLIVAGDFNTTDQSETYRLLTRHLENAHWEAGRGFGFTFPAPRAAAGCRLGINPLNLGPLARIDHIFYSQHFYAHRAYTLAESGGSDHFPVFAELSFRE